MRRMKLTLTLKKDIVIPSGTVFNTAPSITKRYGDGHVQALISLSDDTCGEFNYCLTDLDEDIFDEYFRKE